MSHWRSGGVEKNLIRRGGLVGAIAGLLTFVFARILAEPQINKAIEDAELRLQPAAASPRKASPATANRARVDRNVSMKPTIAIATCVTQ